MIRKSNKFDPEFMKVLKGHVVLNKETGSLHFDGLYALLALNVSWKKETIRVPYSHVVWFLTYGAWPEPESHIDHINDNPMDNKPSNLQQLTQAENHEKRRGRIIYRSYGTGKYGHGLQLHKDKRDGRFYLGRRMSRGQGEGDLKRILHKLGGFDSLSEAENVIQAYIEEIEIYGIYYVPSSRSSRKSRLFKVKKRLARKLRIEGKKLKEIASLTGLNVGVVHKATKDIFVSRSQVLVSN